MQVTLELDRNMRIIGNDGRDHETVFDTSPKVGGENTAASPMEVMLQAMGACSFMDTISILRKKRKHVDNLIMRISGERGEEHPKVFTKVHLAYELVSPDAKSRWSCDRVHLHRADLPNETHTEGPLRSNSPESREGTYPPLGPEWAPDRCRDRATSDRRIPSTHG